MRMTTLVVFLALAVVVSGQVGWELEVPEVQIVKINPSVSQVLIMGVRNEVPFRKAGVAITHTLTNLGAGHAEWFRGDGTVNPAFFQGLWRFTVDGLTNTKATITPYDAAPWTQEAGVVELHNGSPQGILELKTAVDNDQRDGATSPVPFTQATLTDVRAGFNRIDEVLLGELVQGRLTVVVSPQEHWVLKFNGGGGGGKAKFAWGTVQFTYNIALENLQVRDLEMLWPEAPVSDGLTALQKNAQRLLLKWRQIHDGSGNKNGMPPYVKKMDLWTPHQVLKDVPAFANTTAILRRYIRKAPAKWKEADIRDIPIVGKNGLVVKDKHGRPKLSSKVPTSEQNNYDAFLKTCINNYPLAVFFEPCLAPYADMATLAEREQPEWYGHHVADGRHWIRSEERVPASDVSRFPFVEKYPLANVVANTPVDVHAKYADGILTGVGGRFKSLRRIQKKLQRDLNALDAALE